MRWPRLLLMVLFLVPPAKADKSTLDADWHRFRKLYPYHIQTVALSEAYPDGHRTMIISEPPPEITLQDITGVSQDFSSVFVGKHSIGVDGWAKDVLIDLPPLSDSALSSDINRLHRRIFGTAYKAYALSIPENLTSRVHSRLDLHVGSADLASWLLPPSPARMSSTPSSSRSSIPATVFTPLLGGEALSCDSILRNRLGGVYLSHPAGLVLWSLSKSRPIDSLSAQVRQFALDTDMVVGAIGRGDQLVIVGRERTTDVSLLPPLRTETVLQLAAAKEDELEQSYERTNLMAGPAVDQEGRSEDWAPILLSPRLIDTEYGSLLNITDQLLKGWSQHGAVKYVNFQYPEPSVYPFTQPLTAHLGVSTLTFNWNTKGAGYVTKNGPYEVFALNRTGALPIDYLAEGRSDVEKAEDDAYDWYAGLSDPNLIRVVEYAALYQIFHHFGIHSPDRAPGISQPFATLEGSAESFLRELSAFSDDDLVKLKTLHNSPGSSHFIDDTLRPTLDFLRLCADGRGPVAIRQIAMASVDPSAKSTLLDKLSRKDAITVIHLFSNLFHISNQMMETEDKSKALMAYVSADTQHPGRWIRTPSVVESSNDLGIGGHNVGANVTVLEVDDTLAPGKVAVRENTLGERVLHYNPRDEVRATGVIREVARKENVSSAELAVIIEQRMLTARTTKLSMKEGLGIGPGTTPDPLRGLQVSHIDRGYSNFGWKPSGSVLADSDAATLRQLNSGSNQVMLVTRSAEGKYRVQTGGGKSIEATDQASAIDALLQLAAEDGETRVHLHTKGFDDRQTTGFLTGAGRFTDEYEIVATREEDLPLDTLKEIIHDRYDVKQAKFSEIRISEPDAAGFRSAEQDITIPSKSSVFRDIVFTIKARISAALDNLNLVKARFRAQISSYFENLQEDRDIRAVGAELVRSLRKEGVYAEVTAQMTRDGRKVFFVDNTAPSREKTKDRFAA